MIERGDVSMMEQRLKPTAFEDSGIFKDRSTSQAPVVIRNPFEWVPDQIHTLAGMAHMAEPMRDARRLIDGTDIKRALTKAGGEKAVDTINSRLAEMVSSPYADEVSRGIVQHILGMTARAKLAFRVSSIAKQRLGLLQAATYVRDAGLSARLIAASANPTTLVPAVRAKLRAEIETRSGYLAQRADPTFAASVASAANPNLRVAKTAPGRAWQAFERLGLSGLRLADSDVVLTTYKEIKADLARKGAKGDALIDAAVKKTELVIRESQNPTSMLDMSGLHLAGRRNVMLGFYTMFSSSANKMRNLMRQSYAEYKAKPTGENLRKLASASMLSVSNAVMSRVVGTLLSGGTIASAIAYLRGDRNDEKKPKTAKDQAAGVVSELADQIMPGGGTLPRMLFGLPSSSGSWIEGVRDSAKAAAAIMSKDEKRTTEKAEAWVRFARSVGVLPDALLDYTGSAMRGISGPEPAGWSVKAALERNDEEAAIDRGAEYIRLRESKDDTKDRNGNLRDAALSLRASIADSLNKDVAKDDKKTREANGRRAQKIAREAYERARK